jgi:hypothetical protein
LGGKNQLWTYNILQKLYFTLRACYLVDSFWGVFIVWLERTASSVTVSIRSQARDLHSLLLCWGLSSHHDWEHSPDYKI